MQSAPDRWRRWRLPALAVAAALTLLALVTLIPLSLRLKALRARHAIGPSWSFPSRIYSDGVSLVRGRLLPETWLEAQLEARGYRRAEPPLEEPGTWGWTGDGVEIFLRGFRDAPDPAGWGGPERVRFAVARGRITAVERLGGMRGTVPPDRAHPPRLEPVRVAEIFDSLHVRRSWLPLARVPRSLQDAVIASEDRRFRSHLGLDLRSNLRALATNVRAGSVRQGASTITQQLARNLFLGRERTFARKLAEAWIAVGLEILLSKDDILEMYLNSLYWGQAGSGGVAGVAEAARWYFDAPPEALRPEQSALLAALIPAPNTYSPFRNPRAARQRRNVVIAAMAETGKIPAREAARLRTRPLGARRGAPAPERFPSFTGHVRAELARAVAPGAAEHWGLAVFTTLDLAAQESAESSISWSIAGVEARIGLPRRTLEGGCVIMDAASGDVRALVGGRDPEVGTFNRATQALRQPGSAIKPIVFAAALDPGRGEPRYTPASTVPDLRRRFPTPEGPWTPRNDHDEYHPEVTLAKALAKSLNVATANLVEAIGPVTVARYAERFGLGRPKPVASIGLGSNEVTLLALTGAYATFANRGVRVPPRVIRAVVDGKGEDPSRPAPAPARVLPRATADLMTGLLEDVVIFGVAYPLRAEYGFTRLVAGKTGTTNDFNDGWFVGYTPELVAGVWVGCDTPRSLGDVAAQTALPVWADVVSGLLDGYPPSAPFPADSVVELAWLDPWTGGLANGTCPRPLRVPFLPGTRPTRPCPILHAPEPSEDSTGVAADSAAAMRVE